MNFILPAHRKSSAWFRWLGVAVTVLAVACAVVVEALHGHECAGDGCILCLITTSASGLLILCTCIVAVQPLILALVHVWPTRTKKLIANMSHKLLAHSGIDALKASTPVSLGVMLRI